MRKKPTWLLDEGKRNIVNKIVDKGRKAATRWMERVATSIVGGDSWDVNVDMEEGGGWVGNDEIFLVVRWTRL